MCKNDLCESAKLGTNNFPSIRAQTHLAHWAHLLTVWVVLQHVKSATDKRVKRPAAAAATAAVQAASSSDELAHFDRRVEIVAHWLALNDEAASFDASTPKLKPAEAMNYAARSG